MYKLNVGNLVNIKNNKLKMHTVAHGCTPKNKKVSIYAVFRALCLVTSTKESSFRTALFLLLTLLKLPENRICTRLFITTEIKMSKVKLS